VIKPPPYSKNCSIMTSLLDPLLGVEEGRQQAPDYVRAIQQDIVDFTFDDHVRESGCQECGSAATIAMSKGEWKPTPPAWPILCQCGRVAVRGKGTCDAHAPLAEVRAIK
jgi:hypothetical protein